MAPQQTQLMDLAQLQKYNTPQRKAKKQLPQTLAEKRQRHYRSLLSAAEESVTRRLREKEAEVEKASRRNKELEAKAPQLSMESHAWRHRAKMQEHMTANFQGQLERAITSRPPTKESCLYWPLLNFQRKPPPTTTSIFTSSTAKFFFKFPSILCSNIRLTVYSV
ncbi:OLC1v1018622C1 [Oldenlandia corymbosa var. corymbosa]|uniref:OLC1v1018622C1 n=1 Tax=Oldenlandia corymbosa var. corymbosa TaxID=529605 RepID=A0AAV1EC20_OLDCO|nr:OLC1v1018622C1 [Oldenlandia corymbosa var. corymbosa]